MSIYTTIDSPIGRIVLTGEETATGVALTAVKVGTPAPQGARRADAPFAEAVRQFAAYFAGERTAFDLDLRPAGTDFQHRVWAEVAAVPYGRTTTYGEVAARIGAPRDRIRAVGAAVGANPLLIVRPCHRVIGAGGALTGYAAGIERKRFLLTHEGALQPTLI
ncbi:methylated-DNA--[protein]-cysteine S-methyltransferase [Nonomuraea typhae]|uniref:methylated-DNA--[protein]-cysteine S-methyltransferase n=1 Tax=Nonomuraea typhae TaxID=2603600 RepID=UPI0012FC65F0|nr:methylated-DNA--[protein]-cysteine S-methyltransferase [Nonomuraea typhae]